MYLWKRRQTDQQRPFLSICACVYYLKLSPLLMVKNVLTPTRLFPSILAQPVVNFRCPDMTTKFKALSSRSHNFPLEVKTSLIPYANLCIQHTDFYGL